MTLVPVIVLVHITQLGCPDLLHVPVTVNVTRLPGEESNRDTTGSRGRHRPPNPTKGPRTCRTTPSSPSSPVPCGQDSKVLPLTHLGGVRGIFTYRPRIFQTMTSPVPTTVTVVGVRPPRVLDPSCVKTRETGPPPKGLRDVVGK